MRSMKRGLAVFLAVLLMMPAMPVSAGEIAGGTAESQEIGQTQGEVPGDASGTVQAETPGTGSEGEPGAGTGEVPGTGSEGEPGTGTEGTPGTGSEGETGAGTGEAPGTGSEGEPGAGTEGTPGTGSEVKPGTGTGEAPGTGSEEEPGADTGTAPGTIPGEMPGTVPGTEGEVQPEENKLQDLGADGLDTEAEEVFFNTGSHTYRVTDSSVSGNLIGDACFGEDGCYTIHIPEENPFFPYEVQFTYKGETTKEWFMTPDDSVTIGGHTFYVSAYFDNTAVTQMSLNVAGDTIIVYPEEKEFTEDGGAMPLSLLPLPEKDLKVDLSAYTPAELTMVSVSSIFTGANALKDVDKVVWAYDKSDDDFKVSPSNGIVDLSYQTSGDGSNSTRWQMIVGAADQLAADNTRYMMTIQVKGSRQWLTPVVYSQDGAGNRTVNPVGRYYYGDWYTDKTNRELTVNLERDERKEGVQLYAALSVNPSVFASLGYSSMKVYEGRFLSAVEAMAGPDITGQICAADMTQPGAGYPVKLYNDQDITIVTFDAAGNATGCLPISLYFQGGNFVSLNNLMRYTVTGWKRVEDASSSRSVDGCIYTTVKLYKGYAADDLYYQAMSYYKGGQDSPEAITAAYVGQYSSIAEATAAGASDIKATLFGTSGSRGDGYEADYSQGVYFTIFAGADGDAGQQVYRYNIKTEEGTKPQGSLSSDTSVRFTGLKDSGGGYLPCYIAPSSDDSYGENNFITILVKPYTDLTNLAPIFSKSDSINLYTTDESTPEISGESFHDFSKGPVQYTASAEDKEASRNYWVKIVKASDGIGQLYINSLEDADSNTRTENGVIYSTRQVMLDGYHDNVHDIWLANIGTADIPALSSELVSDVVELDEYWRLNGDYKLAGFNTVDKNYVSASHGELPNLAKIRLKAKAGVENGTEVSGTLTIKSAGTPLMVLTLTGTVGDPCITTKEIPQAVKYVPYGTMIQNNNKYSWNKVSYELTDGTLPGGMMVMPNGELYGVPVEAGEFTFTVRMNNSGDGRHNFRSSSRTFTLIVVENTDPNVDGATDTGYDLTQRVQDIYLDASGNAILPEESRTMVSQGVYGEFVDIFLDGVKLVPGTDYNSESGSTRITILNQTLLMSGADSAGTHTLGVEFRMPGDNTLKRAAQNYVIHYGSNTGGSGGTSGGSGSSGGGSSSSGSSSNGSNSNLWNANANVLNGVNGAAAFAGAAVAGTVEKVTYTIAAGDSLWKIAVRFYGSGSYWQKIFNDNADVISNPDQIYAGQQIVIYLEREGGAAQEGAGNETGRTYVVESGDTLWKISEKVYGRGWSWRRIYQANEDIISEPGNIYAGQVIKIP